MAERHQLYQHHWRLLNGYIYKGFLRLGGLSCESLSVSFVDGGKLGRLEFSE